MMTDAFAEVHGLALAAVLALAMAAGWGIGWWRGKHVRGESQDAPGKFGDAIMALLGLLLGFTFSISLSKHEQRRVMVVNDSNAIGDFYTCASLLKEPVRGKLQAVIRAYAEHRLALVRSQPSRADLAKAVREVPDMHARMQAHVNEAIEQGTPVVVPLVNTLNAVTSSHAARLAAAQDRLPASVVLLLMGSATVMMVLMGRHQGAARKLEPGALIGFVILVSMVFWVTADLNEPLRGVIQVSQEPLELLVQGMGK